MLELPEAYNLSLQIEKTLKGKKIKTVIPLQSPHKLTWFNGDPENYRQMLEHGIIEKSYNLAGMVKIDLRRTSLLFSDGINLRYFPDGRNLPKKHQLLIEFSDSTFLCSSTQMYGGVVCFQNGVYDNEYYRAAMEKPSPLTDEFNQRYFEGLTMGDKIGKLSAKAFLATEQRIPGLGNGALQDILFNASIHPKRKMNTLSDNDKSNLFKSVKSTLKKMCDQGGRYTEKDLFGNFCGYKTILCKNTVGKPCPRCGSLIEKANYMGGSIYFCNSCQEI